VLPVRHLITGIVLVLTVTACGTGGGTSSEALAALNGDWILTSGSGPSGQVEVGDGVEVTLSITEDRWGGTVCNSYGAQDVEVGDGTVTINDVFRTEMACLDDRIMRAEDVYLEAFGAVRAYEVTADELRLTGDGVELVYAPVGPTPTASLVGTVWVLDTLFEGTGPDGSARSTLEEATLELLEDGRILASSGCLDREDGTYEEVDGQLVTAFATDYDYDCETEELWAQDTHVWQVLGEDPTFEVEGQRLTLWAGELGASYRSEAAAGDA
jgi:heat shock protein HslJ